MNPSLWKNNQFISLFSGNLALFFGFSATILVRSLITWELTHDEMALAYINLVTAGGIFITSLFSGVIIDRVERKKLLLIAHTLILISEFATLFLYSSGMLTYHFLLLLSVTLSVTFPFVVPTRSTMLVPAVGKLKVAKATAVMSSSISLARMSSPAVAGFLADGFGLEYAYIFIVCLYTIALLFVFTLKPDFPKNVGKKSFITELKVGFSYIFNNKPLAACMLFSLFPMLVIVPLQNLLVVFTQNVWVSGGSGLGILMMAMGLGGLFGAIIATRFKGISIAKPMIIASLCTGGFVFLFSQSPTLWQAAIMILLIYSCSVLTQTLAHTAIQLMTDDYVRGRVTTISLMSFGLAPIGTIPLAYASKHIGAPWAMSAGALFIIISSLLVWFFMPSFRRIDEVTKQYRPQQGDNLTNDHADTIL